jgi:hypothetical protein
MMQIQDYFAAIQGTFRGLNVPQVDFSEATLQNILGFVFIVVGIMSVFVVFWGGFQYVKSLGDPQKTKQAKDTILYALIGMVVAIAGGAIVSLVAGRVG